MIEKTIKPEAREFSDILNDLNAIEYDLYVLIRTHLGKSGIYMQLVCEAQRLTHHLRDYKATIAPPWDYWSYLKPSDVEISKNKQGQRFFKKYLNGKIPVFICGIVVGWVVLYALNYILEV